MNSQEALRNIDSSYKYGFVTDIESERPQKGLNEETIKFISNKKNEPKWMLEWRLKAFARWKKMKEPSWANITFPKIDYQDIYYFAAPKGFEKKPKSLDEVDPKLIETYNKLGIPLKEQKILAGVAVDAGQDTHAHRDEVLIHQNACKKYFVTKMRCRREKKMKYKN